MKSCAKNSDCKADAPICEVISGLCIECAKSQDCSLGYTCVENKCVEIPYCGEDINCADYYPYIKCKKNSNNLNICVECNQDEDCPYFRKCRGGRCVSTQDSPRSCLEGCEKGYKCVNGFCRKTSNILLYIILTAILMGTIFLIFKKR